MTQAPAVPIGEVAAINPAFRATAESPDDLVDFLPMSAVNEQRTVAEPQESRSLQEVQKGYTHFKDGDVLLAKITPCFENGKIAQVRLTRTNGFGSTEFHVVRPNNARLDARYLVHFLRRDQVRLDGERKMTGSGGQKRVPKHFLESLAIPLPPLPEQRRIAAILDHADALRAKRREALAQLDRLAQAIFIEMFGDPVTNPMGWPRMPIGSIGTVITGNTPPRDNPANYGDEIEWVKSDNINTPYYYLTAAQERLSLTGKATARVIPPGAILVTCIAGSPECIGNAAMADREVAFNQQINAFIPNAGDPHFFYAQLINGKKLIQGASSGGMKGIVTKSRFEQISLITPPLESQRRFSARQLTVNQLVALERKALDGLETLFTSLQHRAFQGTL